MELPGAAVRFEWRFREAGPAATRMSQSVTLAGPRASDYVGIAESELPKGIPPGMDAARPGRWRKRPSAAGRSIRRLTGQEPER